MPTENKLKETIVDLAWIFKDRKVLTKLPTKTPAYLLKLPYSTENIYVDFYTCAGIALESEKENGYGHLLEHYLSEILYQKYGHDLESNGRINYEEMNLYIKTNIRTFTQDIEDFLTTVLNPVFDNDKILTYEKRAIVNEINNSRHQLDQKIIDETRRHRFANDGAYSRAFSDQIENTKAATLQDIENYYYKIFNSNNSFLLISASFFPPAFKKQLIEILNRHPLGPGEKLSYPEMTQAPTKIVSYPDSLVSGTYLSISFPSVSFKDDEAEFLCVSLLSKLITGRSPYGIGKEAREHGFYGLTYRLSRFHHSGFLSFNTYLPTEEIDIFLELLASKIRFLKEENLPDKEVEKYAKISRNQDRNCWRSNGCRMDWVSSDLLHQGHLQDYSYVKEAYKRVSADRIRHVAQRVFDANYTQLILYGELPTDIDKLRRNFSI